ncbi:uncharacterized protein LOC130051746 isoform X2 [Ostrea edulis]|uniref:uncharacterized protein LOC130051746 isoform X2 n=1 Tax=Ostrea edulis TaxID=37623 RepID=UPI0024AFA519|nr:uncharacterized protein LOC130051746 isoform X2 [Ostrea edulis]
MAFKDMIILWNDGVNSYLEEEFEEAISKFQQIENPNARIFYNIAFSYLQLNRLDDAINNLRETVQKDQHLAIAHFCKGLVEAKLHRYREAIADFDNAVERLRSATFIDYTQIGMAYKLTLSEIWIAKATAMTMMGKRQDAEEFLIAVSQQEDDETTKRNCIQALQKLQDLKKGVPALKRRLSLNSQSWFHGHLSRQEAETMLHKEGDFLVRESLKKKTNEFQYVLSVLWQGCRHILILQDEEGYWKFESYSFPSIQELIEYQQSSGKPVTKRSKALLKNSIGQSIVQAEAPELYELPDSCIFHPSKELLKNVDRRNYLGKSKVISAMGQTVRRKQRKFAKGDDGEDENFERPDQDSVHISENLLPRPRPNRNPPKSPLTKAKRQSEFSNKSSSSRSSADSVQTFYSRRPPPALPRTLSRSMEDLSIQNDLAEYESEPFIHARPVIPPRGRMSADLEHMYVNTMNTRKPVDNTFNSELTSALNKRLSKDKSYGSTSSRPAAPARPPPPRRN